MIYLYTSYGGWVRLQYIIPQEVVEYIQYKWKGEGSPREKDFPLYEITSNTYKLYSPHQIEHILANSIRLE